MPVQKAVDLIGEGPNVEAAVEEALDRAGLTLEGITSFTVQRISVDAGPDDPTGS